MEAGERVKFTTEAGFGRKVDLDGNRKVALHRGTTPDGKVIWLTMGMIGDCETSLAWSDEAFAALVQMYFDLTVKAEAAAALPEWQEIGAPA